MWVRTNTVVWKVKVMIISYREKEFDANDLKVKCTVIKTEDRLLIKTCLLNTKKRACLLPNRSISVKLKWNNEYMTSF